jgi:hypothetical protein
MDMNRKVYHYTIGRSGSTVISQLLKALFGRENVWAGHDPVFLEDERPVVITVRDFRDVLASKWRVHSRVSREQLDKKKREMTASEFDRYLHTVRGEVSGNLNSTYKRNKNILLMRYEEFFPDNFDFIFNKFEKHFNIEIDTETRKELSEKYCLKANKKRADKFKTFEKFDKEYIHGEHIYKGKIGTWKDIVPKRFHNKMNKMLKKHLEEWGYKV